MEEVSAQSIAELQEENKFLRKLLKEAPVSIHINKVDEQGQNMPVWVNDNYEELVGYTLKDRQSLGYINSKSGIYHLEDAETIKNAVNILMADRNLKESIIFRFYKKSGELRWIYMHSRAIEYQGDPNHFISIGFDVTDKLVINQDQLAVYSKEIAQLKNKIKINLLTKTERIIIKELTKGKTSQQIADLRARSYQTVNNQKRSIFNKLGIHKTTELVNFALENGLN